MIITISFYFFFYDRKFKELLRLFLEAVQTTGILFFTLFGWFCFGFCSKVIFSSILLIALLQAY